jgi:hypothetical protein
VLAVVVGLISSRIPHYILRAETRAPSDPRTVPTFLLMSLTLRATIAHDSTQRVAVIHQSQGTRQSEVA